MLEQWGILSFREGWDCFTEGVVEWEVVRVGWMTRGWYGSTCWSFVFSLLSFVFFIVPKALVNLKKQLYGLLGL